MQTDPVNSLVTGLPLDLRFRTKGLREYLEGQEQAYVLRVASSFMVTLAPGPR